LLTVGLYYDVAPGREKEFEDYFEAVKKEIEKFDGFKSAILYRRVDRQNSYLIYSEWKDKESFERFLKSQEFSGAKSAGSNMLISRPYHKIYNI
jgi:heme-degrading monooxygenase HmoA